MRGQSAAHSKAMTSASGLNRKAMNSQNDAHPHCACMTAAAAKSMPPVMMTWDCTPLKLNQAAGMLISSTSPTIHAGLSGPMPRGSRRVTSA